MTTMTPQLMVQPSALMTSGVQIREFGDVYLGFCWLAPS